MKNIAKKLGRLLGFEVKKYSFLTSETAQIQQLFSCYNIDLVLDVGANQGQYVRWLRNLDYQGRIVSFEPLSNAYSRLKKLSSKDTQWEIAPRLALGNQEGEILLNIAGNSQSSSVLKMLELHKQAAPDSVYTGSELVTMTRLDNLAQGYIQADTNSIFLKIDVQGFEKQVLEGAKQILPKVKGIQIELSLVPLYEDQLLFKDMLEFLENIGYEIYTFIPAFADNKTGRLLQTDVIFIKS